MENRRQQLLDLLERRGRQLHALLTRLTLREDVAEDLMQELFVKLSQAKPQHSVESWEAYARTTAMNLAFTWRRRHKRKVLALDEQYDAPLDSVSPLGKLIQDEQVEEVLGAVDKLRGAAREAFVMRYVQQDSYELIAEQLDKTVHQVRALCSRAMRSVRDLLGQNHFPPGRKAVPHVEP